MNFGVRDLLKEPLRFSFDHVWNYVLLFLIVLGTLLWRLAGVDGRLVLGAVAGWIVIGRVCFPAIIHEHVGFLNRWVFHDYEKANARYRLAVNSGKATTGAYCALGSLTFAEGDTPESAELLKKASSRLPQDVPVKALLTSALLRLGSTAEAFERAQESLSISNSHPLSHVALGDVFAHRGDLQAAAGCYEKALELCPNAAEYHLRLGEVYGLTGYQKEAWAEFEKARGLSPKDPDVLYWWGRGLRGKGRLKAARRTLQSALEQRPLNDDAYRVPYKEMILALSDVMDES